MSVGCGKANSYTPKKITAARATTTSQAKVMKQWGVGGGKASGGNFGQPKVRMSFGKR